MCAVMKSCRLALATVLSALCVLVGSVQLSHAQAEGQKSFPSSKDAIASFIEAVSDNDRDQLQALLGPESEQIVSSGDENADKQARDQFVSEYKVKHSLRRTGAHQYTLIVGKNEWPLPIPLVQAGDKWYWDGAAGREEMLFRRIGHNEMSAIEVCKGVVAAQREYASRSHDGHPSGMYASRLVSETGTQNGLYWVAATGATPSPAGPFLAQADADVVTSGEHTPYHGYYYRMLRNSGGFGFLAYPAEYRSSGVMTFITDQDGTIYEKDLGEKTAEIAQKMTEYKRDGTWTKVK